MDYLFEIIVFLGAIIALLGETWDKNAIGLSKRITTTGKIAAVLVIVGFLLVLLRTYYQRQDSEAKDLRLQELSKKLETLDKANLYTDFNVDAFGDAHLRVANVGSHEIIVLTNMMIHWRIQDCLSYHPMPVLGLPGEFEETIRLTSSDGFKRIFKGLGRTGKSGELKYSPGDYDIFHINLIYPPRKGVFFFRVSFTYTKLSLSYVDLTTASSGKAETHEHYHHNELEYESTESYYDKCIIDL